MNNKMATSALALIFAVYPMTFSIPRTFADAVALTDNQLDGIAAGDGEWVLAQLDHSKEDADLQDKEDGKGMGKSNELRVQGESQSELKAVSNANTMDSAVAVQSNITHSTDGAIDVNQTNNAEMKNETPKDTFSIKASLSKEKGVRETDKETQNDIHDLKSNKEFSHTASSSDKSSIDKAAASSSDASAEDSASESFNKSFQSSEKDAASAAANKDASKNSAFKLDDSLKASDSSASQSEAQDAKSFDLNKSFSGLPSLLYIK